VVAANLTGGQLEKFPTTWLDTTTRHAQDTTGLLLNMMVKVYTYVQRRQAMT
jgi:hypothetical protein